MNTAFHVGAMLKKIIVARKYTRVEITQAMQVPSPALYAYEIRPSLQLSILIRLCHAMK